MINDGPLLVGDTNEVNNNFKGRIDELRIRPCELTEGQVKGLYEAAPALAPGDTE